MKKLRILVITTLAMFFVSTASAQDLSVQTGNDGVKIKNGDMRVVTGDEGVELENGAAKVKTGKKVKVVVGKKKKRKKVMKKKGFKHHAPFTCKGNEDINLKKVFIDTEGVAIKAMGNCTLKITKSDIVGHETAILVTDNATVEIVKSHVAGKKALVLKGNADLTASKTKFNGKIVKKENADITKAGGNKFGKFRR